jgi:HemK-related putative methylase
MTAAYATARRLLGEPSPGPLRRLLGKLLSRYLRLTGRARYDRCQMEDIQGTPIVILPTVFNPRVLRSGAFFAKTIATGRLGAGGDVLDLGTGSGVCAVFASRHARRVVAVDINRAAVRCAGINAALNDAANVECRPGDLFGAVPGERFDAIFFNPPFYVGEPADERDAAWRSPDGAERFARELDAHLSPGGRAWLLLSSHGDACPRYVTELEQRGFALCVHASREYINERVTILQVCRAGG